MFAITRGSFVSWPTLGVIMRLISFHTFFESRLALTRAIGPDFNCCIGMFRVNDGDRMETETAPLA
jgi:hypothetical protein